MKKVTEATPNRKLLEERLQRGWSQQEVAAQVGTTRINVSRWERGITIPTPYFRHLLCTLFKKENEELGFIQKMIGDSNLSQEAKLSEIKTDISLLPSSLWNIPFLRNPLFTSREETFISIHKMLYFHQKSASASFCAIRGMGGIGKTQIAIEYAYRHYKDYQAVLWIRADTYEVLIKEIACISTLLQLESERKQLCEVEAFKLWLEEQTRWLLIFDNVENFEIVSAVLPPKCSGHILLTTQAQAINDNVQYIDLEEMKAEEGSLFLLHRTKIINLDVSFKDVPEALRNHTREISQVLGGLPLALDQAGAYIEETACDLSDYLDLYRTHTTTLLNLRGNTATGHPASVMATLSRSIEKIERVNTISTSVLTLCAFLCPDDISEELIVEGLCAIDRVLPCAATNPLVFDAALAELRKHSLIYRNSQTKMLAVHRLTQTVIKNSMSKDALYEWIERIVKVVSSIFPEGTSETWDQCQRYLPHAYACLELLEQEEMIFPEGTQLLYQVGHFLCKKTFYKEAEKLYLHALKIREKVLGSEHLEVIQCLNELVWLYHIQGEHVQAELLCERVYAVCERTLESHHPHLIRSLYNLATLYYAKGIYTKAESLFQRVIAMRKKMLGLERSSATESFEDVSSLYSRRNGYLKTGAHSDTLHPGTTSVEKSGRKHISPTYAALLLGSLLALFGVFISFLFPFASLDVNRTMRGTTMTQSMLAFNEELTLEKQYFQKKGIGISDGNFVFDTYSGRADIKLKTEAALQIQKGDRSSAVNSLTEATSADPTDGEIQIYNENLHALQSGSPYVTIVIGLAIDDKITDLIRARSIMEAAFLAQHKINSEGVLPGGFRLRILIDNSGPDNANVAAVAQFIANRVNNAGNPDHIIAVVGWPFSSQTTNALDIVTGAHLPMVSQTASSMKLSGSSPYFFRVNPTDNQQAKALAIEASDQLHSKTVLLMEDPTDPYSVSLADAFSEYAAAFNLKVIDSPTNYFMEGVTTVEEYQHKIISNAITSNADLLFMAGFDVDAVRLAHAIGNALRASTKSNLLSKLKIMSGDAVATSLLLGNGAGLDAAIARNFPQDMQKLIFSAFAHQNEWTFEKIAANQQPKFFSDWSYTYHSFSSEEDNTFFSEDHAILTYDAIQVIVKAVTLVPRSVTGEAVRNALFSLGKGAVHTFQGVSGSIAFDSQGNPINKAVVVLDVELINGRNTIVLKQVIGSIR